MSCTNFFYAVVFFCQGRSRQIQVASYCTFPSQMMEIQTLHTESDVVSMELNFTQ